MHRNVILIRMRIGVAGVVQVRGLEQVQLAVRQHQPFGGWPGLYEGIIAYHCRGAILQRGLNLRRTDENATQDHDYEKRDTSCGSGLANPFICVIPLLHKGLNKHAECQETAEK